MTIVKYFFHIIDRQFNDEYDYDCYFEDHYEADRFITENENDGNTVYMRKPFYQEIRLTPDEVEDYRMGKDLYRIFLDR